MNGVLNKSVLLKELKIYQWIFSIFGLNFPPFLIYRAKKDFWYYLVLLVYFAYAVFLLVVNTWVTYVHNRVVYMASIKNKLDSITELGTYIQNYTLVFMQLLFGYKCWCCRQKFLEILLLIRNQEDKLKTSCPVVFKDQMPRKRLFMTTGSCLFILMPLLLCFHYMVIAGSISLVGRLSVMFFMVSMEMKFIEYGMYVQLINEYLLILLEDVKCIKARLENEVDRKQPLPRSYQKELRQNQMSLGEIWYLIHKIEHYFAWPIFLLFFYNGIVILCTINWAYVQTTYESGSYYQICRLALIFIIFLNMLVLCYLTQNCINEYRKFSQLLLNFKLYPHDVSVIFLVKEYSLQLMQQTIQFTCDGFIDIDLKCYGKATLVILAYIIILVQFKVTDDSEAVVTATNLIFGRV